MILCAAIGGLAFGAYAFTRPAHKGTAFSHKSLAALWNSGDVAKTLEQARAAADTAISDPYYHALRGIAAYYAALDAQEEESRQQLLEESILSLRKARAIGLRGQLAAQCAYVLAKAYYQKGDPWLDLAEREFHEARKGGVKEQDLAQYLAAIYASRKDYANAVAWFERSLSEKPSDLLKLSAAISYRGMGNGEKANQLLTEIISSGTDARIRLKAKLALAQDLLEKGKTAEAKQLFQEVIKEDAVNADAWFGLGLACLAENDQIGSRAAFRKVVQIDPNHIEARRKLAEKL